MKQYLENYGFSDTAIKALLSKKKYETPYGIVWIEDNNLVTKYRTGGRIKREKIKE